MKAVKRDAREMKDSGIEWIGLFPSDWGVMTIKYTSWLKGRIGWQGLKSTEFMDEGPYLITGTDFNQGFVNWSTCAHITNERFLEDEDIHIVEDDLLITKDGTIGKVAVAKNCPEKVSLNSGVLLIRNSKIKYVDKYLYYTLLSDEFYLWYELNQPQNSTIRHLYQGQFYNFKFAFPAIVEQKSIVDYLDDRCAKIDAIIAEAKASIEEYKELKQAVIYETVTKGLDKTVVMKDSGMPWIEDIPFNWKLVKITRILDKKHLYPIGDGDHGSIKTEQYRSDGIPFIRVQNLGWGTELNLDNVVYISDEDNEKIKNSTLKPNDILFAKTGATIGKTGIMPINIPIANTTSHVGKITISEEHNSRYFFYVLSSQIGYRQFWDIALQKTTRPELSIEETKSIKVVLPQSKKIEDEIVEYLDEKIPAFDQLLSEKQSLIEDLEAYKKSLIYEVVTGKRKVVAG